MRTHAGEKPFECDKCDYSAAQKCHLDAHKCSHSAARPYTCNLCNYAGKLKEALKCHQRTHREERPYNCHLCDYTAKEKQCLTRHNRTHSSSVNDNFIAQNVTMQRSEMQISDHTCALTLQRNHSIVINVIILRHKFLL